VDRKIGDRRERAKVRLLALARVGFPGLTFMRAVKYLIPTMSLSLLSIRSHSAPTSSHLTAESFKQP
jgi:hypothetical protein